jgi:prepilin-type N-terminal cleavage/methylation domain-containing protein
MVQQKQVKKGFTIIEVVLVLAIAGLIFMMVFIALPALQRSQRDTQRKNDMARMQSAIVNYQTNNHNRLPGDDDWGTCGADGDNAGANGFCGSYLIVGGDYFTDPDGSAYVLTVDGANVGAATDMTNLTFETAAHRVFITKGVTCDGEQLIASTGGQKVALRYKLEGGGIVCLNN